MTEITNIITEIDDNWELYGRVLHFLKFSKAVFKAVAQENLEP